MQTCSQRGGNALPRDKKDKPDHAKVPWISKSGGIDLNSLPIDFLLKQALDQDRESFRSACVLLSSMHAAGRKEAAVFLYGLFLHNKGDRARTELIVEVMRHVRTQTSAQLLFSELDEIESSNTTRAYINAILSTLSRFPLPLVEAGSTKLLADKKWSYKMKRKFQAILDGVDWRYP